MEDAEIIRTYNENVQELEAELSTGESEFTLRDLRGEKSCSRRDLLRGKGMNPSHLFVVDYLNGRTLIIGHKKLAHQGRSVRHMFLIEPDKTYRHNYQIV